MDALVRWFNSWSCPPVPFAIGTALRVVDGEVFVREIHNHIDRCHLRKDEINSLRERLKGLKLAMESSTL